MRPPPPPRPPARLRWRAPSVEAPALPAVEPVDLLSAELPQGNRVHLRLQAGLAAQADVERLRAAQQGFRSEVGGALSRQSSAVRRLAQLQSQSTAAIQAGLQARDLSLSQRLNESEAKLRQRLEGSAAQRLTALQRQEAQLTQKARTQLATHRRRALWDKALLASSLPLFATYGHAGELTHANNLTLAGILGILLAGDDVLAALGGTPPANNQQELWSILAPVVNIGLAYLLLQNQHQERFVTGVIDVTLPAEPSATSLPVYKDTDNFPVDRAARAMVFVSARYHYDVVVPITEAQGWNGRLALDGLPVLVSVIGAGLSGEADLVEVSAQVNTENALALRFTYPPARVPAARVARLAFVIDTRTRAS